MPARRCQMPQEWHVTPISGGGAVQGLLCSNPRHCESEEHPPYLVQVPPGPGEEPMKGRDVPGPQRAGGQQGNRRYLSRGIAVGLKERSCLD